MMVTWDDETKVPKVSSDRSIYGQTTLDTVLAFPPMEDGTNATGGSITASGFQGTIDTAFSGNTTNPTGTVQSILVLISQMGWQYLKYKMGEFIPTILASARNPRHSKIQR